VKSKRDVLTLAAALAVPLAVGGLAAWLTADNMRMYDVIIRPPLSPPAWLFPVVWTALYLLMGLASYLVYRSEASAFRKKRALKFYAAQLVVNFIWPLIFFRLERYLAAFFCLALLTLLVLICQVLFQHINKTSGRIFTAYLFWCIFALYLNFGVYLLNQ